MEDAAKFPHLKKFIAYQKRYNNERREFIRKNINDGIYPEKFSFPIGIQFELTSQCNLYCKHCYNRSSHDRKPLLKTEHWLDIVSDIIHTEGGFFSASFRVENRYYWGKTYSR